MAGDLIVYTNNLRAIGNSMEYAWVIARRAVFILECLGIQDSARKRRTDKKHG